MLYVIGECDLQTEFLSRLVSSLEGGERDGEKQERFPASARINTKYYSAEVGVRYWTTQEYLESEKCEDCFTCPEAILLILPIKDSARDHFQSNANSLLSVLDKRYPPLSNTDITRLCCVFQSREDDVGPGLRDRLSNKCSQSSFELIVINDASDSLEAGSNCPPIQTQEHEEDDNLVFSFSQGIERVTQALYCTNWSTMHKPQAAPGPDLEQDESLESCLDDFELFSSIMRKMTCDTKHLSDHERRERASNLIHEVVKYLNLDDS